MGWAWIEVLPHEYPIDIQLICGSHISARHGILPRPSYPSLEAKFTKGPLKLKRNPRLLILAWPPPLGGLGWWPSLPPLRKSRSPPPRRRTGGQWDCSHPISLPPPHIHCPHNYCWNATKILFECAKMLLLCSNILCSRTYAQISNGFGFGATTKPMDTFVDGAERGWWVWAWI
jgi:hypothetical protein